MLEYLGRFLFNDLSDASQQVHSCSFLDHASILSFRVYGELSRLLKQEIIHTERSPMIIPPSFLCNSF